MLSTVLQEWVIINRDSEGFGELLYELQDRMIQHREVILNNVRNGKDAFKELGAYDELDSLYKLLTPQPTDASLET